ncbi:MAG: hypothetical protein V1870_03645 [Candidatus Aenigmatarchaeota archaeon]
MTLEQFDRNNIDAYLKQVLCKNEGIVFTDYEDIIKRYYDILMEYKKFYKKNSLLMEREDYQKKYNEIEQTLEELKKIKNAFDENKERYTTDFSEKSVKNINFRLNALCRGAEGYLRWFDVRYIKMYTPEEMHSFLTDMEIIDTNPDNYRNQEKENINAILNYISQLEKEAERIRLSLQIDRDVYVEKYGLEKTQELIRTREDTIGTLLEKFYDFEKEMKDRYCQIDPDAFIRGDYE